VTVEVEMPYGRRNSMSMQIASPSQGASAVAPLWRALKAWAAEVTKDY
jgi:hypothetical protein